MPAYMAPELFRNNPYNKSVDVYAFAITMWELFAQEVPYKGYDPISIRDKVIANQRPPLPLPMASSRMSRLVGDCWYICFQLYSVSRSELTHLLI